jgi:hypothetical protein
MQHKFACGKQTPVHVARNIINHSVKGCIKTSVPLISRLETFLNVGKQQRIQASRVTDNQTLPQRLNPPLPKHELVNH